MKLEYVEILYGDARKISPQPPEKMDTNINFTKVELSKNMLMLDFDYTVIYAPDESHLRLSGKAAFSGAESKKLFDEWQKDKKFTGKEGEMVLNAINYNVSINAIFMAKVFNMVPPIVLPTLTFKKP